MNYKPYNLKNNDEINKKYNSLIAKFLLSFEDNLEDILNYKDLKDNEYKIDHIVDRIIYAKENKQKVLIVGDYDCDGICSSTIMCDIFTKLNIEHKCYIPNRVKEGYGLNETIVDQAIRKNYNLLICVDNGVLCNELLSKLQDNGVDYLVIDHHHYEEFINEDKLLHPNLLSEYYHNQCATGLCYLLSTRLLDNNDFALMLSCIATISDVMKLKNVNRYYVVEGMKLLNKTDLICLKLLNESDVFNEESLMFTLIPKINATGRLSIANPNDTVRYLLDKNDVNIMTHSKLLSDINKKRKDLTSSYYNEIIKEIDTNSEFIIIYKDGIEEGIIGILAGRISNTYNKPCVIFTNKETIKGSIRSIKGVDLKIFFKDFNKLISYGGHELAAGISINQNDLESFKEYVNNKMLDLVIDQEKFYLSLDDKDLCINNYLELMEFRPFGEGFRIPLVGYTHIINDIKLLSNNKHSKIVINESLEVIFFNRNLIQEGYRADDKLLIIGNIKLNEFNKKKSIQILSEDMIKLC